MNPRASSALRVLQVMECTIGGTRRHITDLAQGLAAEGVDVHLAVAAERQPDFRRTLAELARAGCVVHELAMRRAISPAADLRHCWALTRLLRRVRPDIVHTHSSKAGALGRAASLLTGIGLRVHTPHTFAFLFHEMFGPRRRRFYFELERCLAARTECLIAVSQSEARTFAASGVVAPGKIRVVPNGIDPRPFAQAVPLDLRALGLEPALPTAALVGLLNPAKGQDLALRALAEPGVPEDLQLVVAGSGDERARLEALAAELGLGRRVVFLGFRHDVPALLAACDFLLLPSRWEGMPYIVLEAMAAALPVLATPVDGALDLIEPGVTGWLAHAVSVEALAASLAQALALAPAERAALGARGRERVLESYTCSAMVRGLLEVYASLP
jgi:glycosyltransferase involved in cell wall biosynthesis